MKKYVLFGLLLAFVLPLIAQSGSIRVSTGEADVNRASIYYYSRLVRQLDMFIAEGKIAVYRDEALKEKIQADQFMKETRLQYTAQVINPETPDDPYNLIDTVLWASQAVSLADYLEWKEKSIQVFTSNQEGKTTYYLSQKEIEKQKHHEGYKVCALFSKKFGQVNTQTLGAKSGEFLKTWTHPFFNASGLKAFSDVDMQRPLKVEDLKKSKTFNWGGKQVIYNYFPESADSCRAIYLSYRTEMEDDEFEMNIYSASLLYSPGNNSSNAAWYWASAESVEGLYQNDEWDVLLAIQAYTIRTKIFPSFEYTGN